MNQKIPYDIQKYMKRFEKEIILKGIGKGVLEAKPNKIVPLRDGKFANTPFGKLTGKSFECEGLLLAIDYYGHFKLSSGIVSAVKSVEHIFPDLKCIRASLIHFNSIKMQHVEALADEEMLGRFARFKKELVKLRWKK